MGIRCCLERERLLAGGLGPIKTWCTHQRYFSPRALAEGMRFIVFKVLERTTGANGQPSLKVAELVVRVRPSDTATSEQQAALDKLRKRAAATGLGKAAAEAGLACA